MAKTKVDYQAGESRTVPTVGVDYMIACVDVDGDQIELYAEMENPTWDEEKEEYEDETATYQELKEEILRQAKETGIPESDLDFMYG